MVIERCASNQQRGWLELRRALWPHPAEEHLQEMNASCADAGRFASFIAYDDSGAAVGFAEASLRRDYVNGTSSSPVGYLEGIYVTPAARKRGVGRSLVEAAEQWARTAGCTEMASDALLDNVSSHAVHRALGFEETDRVVYFRKDL